MTVDRMVAGRRGLASALLVCALALAGCGSSPVSSPDPDPGPGSSTSPPPSTAPTSAAPSAAGELLPAAKRCGETGAGPKTAGSARMITAGSSEGLYGIEAGAGTRGVVLVHGSGSRGLCNWSQELGWLPGAGFHVLAYDQSCVGESGCDAGRRPVDDILAVVAYLRGRGARTVTVVGASAGGPAVLVASSRPGSGITAAVSLSAAGIAEPLAGGGVTAAAAARSIRIPVLYALARDDTASSVAEVTALHRATKGSRLSLLPAGAGHAQAILYDATGQRPSPFRAPFLRFLHRP